MKNYLMIFLVIIGIGLLFTISNTIPSLFNHAESNQAKITKEIDTLDFHISSVEAIVVPEKRSNIQAKLSGKGTVNVRQKGNKIIIEYKRKWFEQIGFFSSPKLTVYIPEDYNKSMDISVSSGSLKFAGDSKNHPMELKDLSINIGSGHADLSNLTVDTFTSVVSSGNFEVNSVTSNAGDFDVSSGRLVVKHYSGELQAEVSSGLLNIQLDELTGPADVTVSSGSVKLDLPEDADFTLHGKVSSGVIHNNFQLKNEITSDKKFEGTYGSGKHPVNLQVSSGAVTVH
ncbi:LiaG family protein [Bacillus cihuensis]|uniref:LiaG family protein n=1 Tax=Bacillus cihuensis TaxID=1208599 RepID=UPI000408D2DA|nr:DUF4097 family beta strand repeat-containing protein [Bacillus cihuensis]